MNKALELILVLLTIVPVSPCLLLGQSTQSKPRSAASLPPTCSAGGKNEFADIFVSNRIYYICKTTNTWSTMKVPTNRAVVDGLKYPFSAKGIQACIDDAKSKNRFTGVCDASEVPSIDLGATELDVGDSSGSRVELLLPVSATWTTAITDGTSCGIKQFNKTVILGNTTAGTSGFVLSPANSNTHVSALFCTDPSPSGAGSYVVTQGLGVINHVGATMGEAAFVAQHLFDNSTVRDVYVSNTNGKGVLVADVCCSTSFYNVTSDGNNGTGAIPLVVGDSTVGGIIRGGVIDVLFSGGSFVHPGQRLNTVLLSDTSGSTGNITFLNPYMEPNSADTTTSMMEVGAHVYNLTTIGLNSSNSAAGSVAYAIDVAPWAGPAHDAFISTKSQTRNCINDRITATTIISSGAFGECATEFSGGISANGGVSTFSTISANDSVLLKGALKVPNALITSEAPTLSSGFGKNASVIAANGTGAFRIDVGIGGAASTGVIGLPLATTGWNCFATDITTRNAMTDLTQQTASTRTSATIGDFTNQGLPGTWASSDVLALSCFAY
jgi:hypothetical protein